MKLSNCSRPLFSIVVPLYNAELFVEKCINSILSQTFKNFELIIIDDGSFDNSINICKEYEKKDSRVILLSQKNEGPTKARKTGAEIAKGEYIVCVDADDWLAIDYLQKIKDAISIVKADVVCCGTYFAYRDRVKKQLITNEIRFLEKNEIERFVFPDLIQNEQALSFPQSIWAKAVRTELFCSQINRIDSRIRVGEDSVCMIACMAHANNIILIPNCLYYYRQNSNSVTKGSIFDWDGPQQIANNIASILNINEYDFYSQLNRKIVHELFSVLISQLSVRGALEKIPEIKKQMVNSYYQIAIKNAVFSNSFKALLMSYVMRKKLIFVIYIWAKMKRFRDNLESCIK